jgi:uncharacterized membrane protein YdjX (TVP38/TMEM64 family)
MRKTFLVFWFTIVSISIFVLIFRSEIVNTEQIKEYIKLSGENLILIYLLFSVLRSVTILPSMPLVVAGALLFPNNPYLVLLISMFGIIISSTLIYFYSEWLGFTKYFNRKYQMAYISSYLKKYGFWIVLTWSFIPFAPTDAVCYIAGVIKMNFFKFLSGVIIGESLICILIIKSVMLF